VIWGGPRRVNNSPTNTGVIYQICTYKGYELKALRHTPQKLIISVIGVKSTTVLYTKKRIWSIRRVWGFFAGWVKCAGASANTRQNPGTDGHLRPKPTEAP